MCQTGASSFIGWMNGAAQDPPFPLQTPRPSWAVGWAHASGLATGHLGERCRVKALWGQDSELVAWLNGPAQPPMFGVSHHNIY